MRSVCPAPNAFEAEREQAIRLFGPQRKTIFYSTLTKNVQATDLKHERLLCSRVQVVAHFFEAADSLQNLRDTQMRRNFRRRFRPAWEEPTRFTDLCSQYIRPPQKERLD